MIVGILASSQATAAGDTPGEAIGVLAQRRSRKPGIVARNRGQGRGQDRGQGSWPGFAEASDHGPGESGRAWSGSCRVSHGRADDLWHVRRRQGVRPGEPHRSEAGADDVVLALAVAEDGGRVVVRLGAVRLADDPRANQARSPMATTSPLASRTRNCSSSGGTPPSVARSRTRVSRGDSARSSASASHGRARSAPRRPLRWARTSSRSSEFRIRRLRPESSRHTAVNRSTRSIRSASVRAAFVTAMPSTVVDVARPEYKLVQSYAGIGVSARARMSPGQADVDHIVAPHAGDAVQLRRGLEHRDRVGPGREAAARISACRGARPRARRRRRGRRPR